MIMLRYGMIMLRFCLRVRYDVVRYVRLPRSKAFGFTP